MEMILSEDWPALKYMDRCTQHILGMIMIEMNSGLFSLIFFLVSFRHHVLLS